MKNRIIVIIILLITIKYSTGQNYCIKVFEIKDTLLSTLFSKDYLNYQKMTLNNKYVLIADSNALFSEYIINDGNLNFEKKLIHKRFNYNGKLINDICYRSNSDDFLISYKGGCIDQFFRVTNRVLNMFFTSDNIYKIKSDHKGEYVYYCTGYEYSYGGMFSKTPIFEELKKMKFYYADRSFSNDTTIIKPKELNTYQIFNFDFNEDESLFAFVNEHNDFSIIDKSNTSRYNYNNELIIKDFKFIDDDSLLVGLSNGDIIIGTYSNLDFNRPIANISSDYSHIIYNSKNDLCLFVYANSILMAKIKGNSFVKIKEIVFNNTIIDFKQSNNNNTIAVVFKMD